MRIAAIDFLNAAPLMWGLGADARFTLDYTLPSACADALRQGDADLGVIPVIELARREGRISLTALAGMGVASSAAAPSEVRSILLVSRGPVEQARSVSLDAASRTSAALAQILLRHRFAAKAQFVVGDSDWRAALARHDAALIIGDPALRLRISGEAERAGFEVLDLAREWHQWTGLPFVFALWGVRGEVYAANHEWLPARLRQALDDGIAQRSAIAAAWAPRLGIPEAEAHLYLSENVVHRLGPAHAAGLERFFALAAADGLIEVSAAPAMLEVEA
ncbi:MAG TPA: menaquinone biosynthesis protein [Terriglobales bacterium]|nr:menaquinone biosynthesis protein [Terriglobales bacterium]